ncbi:hypothetical protein [Alteribacillus sp. YIM 98480]|uniref:hypothetical protein n=1 Tax=Alteribacillus sp. YIM 98480 TaxID=2606599 RepID=UPI00131DB795|nr:hypothetical protein [Alteribacillus sp. YIM 98480]
MENIINSGDRKKSLSGWLLDHHNREFYSNLKLQKFLFFYEVLSELEEGYSDFYKLKGYEKGPVFSHVYGDHVYRTDKFASAAYQSYHRNKGLIVENRAKLSGFLCRILNDEELSDLTHEFNIWANKEDEILNKKVSHLDLDKEDLNNDDLGLMASLKQMYPPDLIESHSVISLANNNFLVNNNDLSKMEQIEQNKGTQFLKVLQDLDGEESLINPVFLELSDEGVLLVD